MASHRRYTRAQKAQAVAAATITTVEAAAETLGIPQRTLGYWMDKPEFAELRNKSRDHVADEFWAAIQIGLKEVAKGLVDPDEKLGSKSVALGILYDKHALLTGGATGRTESRDLTGTISDADLTAAIREAEQVVAGGRSPSPGEDTPEG